VFVEKYSEAFAKVNKGSKDVAKSFFDIIKRTEDKTGISFLDWKVEQIEEFLHEKGIYKA
jgi:ferritin